MSRWTYRSMVVLAVAWAVVGGAGCPDEPVVENVPPDQGLAPPPPQGGEAPAGKLAAAGAPVADAGVPPAGTGEGSADAQEKPAGQPADTGEASAPGEGPAPGPGGEQFGTPDGIPFTPLPPNILTQEEIKKGEAVTLKGVLVGDRCKGHKTRIEVMTVEEGRPTLITMKLKNGIGQYELLVPKGEAKLWITAVCDVNNNNKIDVNEDYVGAYKDNPVVAKADKAGVVLKFQKPGTKIDGLPPLENQSAPK